MAEWVLVEAEDVFLFRDSRPFTAGEDFRAEGQFPPLPPPVAGAIRSALLAPALQAQGKEFPDLANDPALADLRTALGTADSLGQLRLAGPLVCRYVPGQYAPEPLFALPADVLPRGVPRLRDDLETPGLRRPLPGIAGSGAAAVLDPALSGEDDEEKTAAPEPTGGWLGAAAMAGYLTGATQVAREGLDVLPETRTGIQRSEQGTVTEGRFFNAQMHRPDWNRLGAVGLLMRTELPPGYALQRQFAPLGGEGRSAYLRPLGPFALALDGEDVRRRIADRIRADCGRFRLYLATPGVFGKPGRGGLLPSALPGTLHGVASGKPVSVGGWDLAAKRPRALRRAAPAGTVYFGQLKNSQAAVDDLLEKFHFRTTLQAEEGLPQEGLPQEGLPQEGLPQEGLPEAAYRAQMGFGLTLVGAWTQPQERTVP